MAEHQANQAEPDDEMPRIAVPSADPLPPPPVVSYQRPTLGSAAPARTASERRTSAERGEQTSQMDGIAAGFLNLFRIVNVSDKTRRPK